PTELANRKIVAVELRGSRGVTLINNRRSPEKTDDIELLVRMSPLYYEERRDLVWTDGFVQLLDMQTQPRPTMIKAKGMELHLAKEVSPNRPKAAKAPAKKGENVSGVELVVLRSNVDMHLWVEPGDGFLAGPQDLTDAKARETKETKGPA